MLEILNFSKTYQGVKKAVSDVSLTVEDGDLFAFIGHNGAGKTTTIKAIAGILDFEEGEILVNGKSMKDNPLECKKEIAYIPDQPVLYEHLSGIRYLNFISDVYHISSLVLKQEMNDLCQTGSSIFYSTHVLEVAEKLCNKVAMINEGKLVFTGEMNDITEHGTLENIFLQYVDSNRECQP